MFFMTPAQGADQMRFAFICQGLHYTLTGLLQSLNCSLNICVAHATFPDELEMLKFPQEVTVRQCISDGGGGFFTKPVEITDTCNKQHRHS